MSVAAIKVGDSIQTGLDSFFGFIPNIIGFLVILLIGWIIARVVRTVVNKLMDKLGVDRRLHESPAGEHVEKLSPGAKPSRLIGAVAYWFIFLFALSAAIGALKIPALTDFIAQVQAFLPNVIVAILIFVIAAALAGAVAGAVVKLMGDTPTGKIVVAVVPGLILAIGLFMVLNQLKIAQEIVTITYAAVLGMLALAGALAFGLGGRNVAARMLNDAYESGRQNTDQVKQDVQKGKQEARSTAQSAQATHAGAAGAVSTGDRDRDRKGGGWWKWLLALLVLAAVVIALVSLLGGDDSKDQSAGSTAPAETAPSSAPAGGTPSDSGTLTVAGTSLLPVPNDLSDRVGKQAEGRAIVVQKVEGQQGFWVGSSMDDRVYVEYGAKAGGAEEGAEFKPKVGQKVDVVGEIRPAPAEPGRVLRIAGASEDLVKSQGAYINADSARPSK